MRIFLVSVFLFISSQLKAQKDISLEDIWKNNTFGVQGVYGFNPLSDGKYYSRKIESNTEGNCVVKYSYESGMAQDTLINSKKIRRINGLQKFSFEGYQLSADESKALLTTESERIYRHSYASMVYLLDLKTNKLEQVSDKKIMYCSFDPTQKYLAFVFENNLYLKDLKSNKTKAITKDGKKNSIINGAVDWVYEEEFSMSKGYCWSKDGTQLAYYRFDESGVHEYSMPMYHGLYPENVSFKYPKAGEANSIVEVYVFAVSNGKSRKMNTGNEIDQYLPRIMWTETPNRLSIQRLNRLQNKWEILLANTQSGDASVAYEETDDKYIEITDDLMYLPGGELAVMTSERNGYRQIFLHKANGPEINQITYGKWDVDQIIGYDEKNQLLYYSSREIASNESHVFRISLDGKKQFHLTQEPGSHHANFSNDFSYFILRSSTINQPPVYSVKNRDGQAIRTLEDNKQVLDLMSGYRISKAQFGELKLNNTSLNYYMIKPVDFDSTKTYPLLMFVYGGPGSQQVVNQWSGGNYLWHQMLANKHGYIIACVDNRGTGAKGSAFKKITYKQLGKYESDDQIAAARYFGDLKYIDAGRIGIWGWSYGGFMSSTCILKGDGVFKAAIAIAPVTNWRYYDNIYTERYMQTPKDNPDGYDQNSPINMVDKLKGNFLLVHGTGDDNVHFQNSVEMAKKMIDLNIPFQSAYYPNKSHGISGGNTRLHLFTLMTKFVLENL
ncbi:MAG: S9 family peptidase [Flavobacteriales bacterium]|nr:S9 family peptidase [Flavobacteriales bacterium]